MTDGLSAQQRVTATGSCGDAAGDQCLLPTSGSRRRVEAEVSEMSDVGQTPKRRVRSVTVLTVSVVLLLMGAVFAVGQTLGGRDGQASASSRQMDQPEGSEGPGSMMGWSQDDRDDWSWMRGHMDDAEWMRNHTLRWEWMQADPRMWSWMREHRDGAATADQDLMFRNRRPATGPGPREPDDQRRGMRCR